jgi:hypothetical protein
VSVASHIACPREGSRSTALGRPAYHYGHETLRCLEQGRMTSTLRLGRVAGIDIGAHWSWLLVVV